MVEAGSGVGKGPRTGKVIGSRLILALGMEHWEPGLIGATR